MLSDAKLRLRGKYNVFAEEGRLVLFLQLQDNVEPIWVRLWDYLSIPVKMKISGQIVDASIYALSVKDRRVSLEILIDTDKNDTDAVSEVMGLSGIDGVEVEFGLGDVVPIPVKRVSDAYLKKLINAIKNTALNSGNSYQSLLRFIASQWGHPKFNLTKAITAEEAYAFGEYLREFSETYGVSIPLDEEDQTVKIHLSKCRKENKCVVCLKPSTVQRGSLYPVCSKHAAEFSELGRSKFEERYCLK